MALMLRCNGQSSALATIPGSARYCVQCGAGHKASQILICLLHKMVQILQRFGGSEGAI